MKILDEVRARNRICSLAASLGCSGMGLCPDICDHKTLSTLTDLVTDVDGNCMTTAGLVSAQPPLTYGNA